MKTSTLIIFSVFTVLFQLIFMFLTNRSLKKQEIEYYSIIYGLELDTIRIKYYLDKNHFKNFPLIRKEIEETISLVEDEYVNLKRIKVNRYKIFDLNQVQENINTIKEIENCKDTVVKDLFFDLRNVKAQIAHTRSPLLCKLNGIYASIQFLIFIVLYKMFKILNYDKHKNQRGNIPIDKEKNCFKRNQKLHYL